MGTQPSHDSETRGDLPLFHFDRFTTVEAMAQSVGDASHACDGIEVARAADGAAVSPELLAAMGFPGQRGDLIDYAEQRPGINLDRSVSQDALRPDLWRVSLCRNCQVMNPHMPVPTFVMQSNTDGTPVATRHQAEMYCCKYCSKHSERKDHS